MKKLFVISLAAFLSAGGVFHLNAADSKPDQEEPSKPAGKATAQRSIPFHGKIEAMDLSAKSLKVGTRVFLVSDSTKITKAGKPSSLNEAKVGEEVGGAYRDGGDGKLELTTLRVGPKPEKTK